jgi:hypothetical protein
LRNQIATFPFNTIVFYELISQGWTYDQIVANWQNIFQEMVVIVRFILYILPKW